MTDSTPASGSEALATARELLAHDTFDRDCPTRHVLEAVTSRWGTLVIAALVEGPHRFVALRDRVDGISEKMLSQTLRSLDRAGLVNRAVEQWGPPRVTYSLTTTGEGVAAPLCSLIHRIGAHQRDLLASEAAYDDQERRRRNNQETALEAERGRIAARARTRSLQRRGRPVPLDLVPALTAAGVQTGRAASILA